MKINRKAAAIALPVMLLATPALAATTGQITGGDNYLVRNVTDNGQFTDPASADKCETVQFKVRIHNVGPDSVGNVNVKATLPTAAATSHSSLVTVTSTDSNPNTRTDTAGVNLSGSYKLTYVPGSTELLDANNAKLSTMPDTITSSGVNIGEVGVSTQQKRFVQFQAKVDCPVTPDQPKPTPTPEQPVSLPETGPEAGLAAAAGTGALGYAVHMYRRSRKSLVDAVKRAK